MLAILVCWFVVCSTWSLDRPVWTPTVSWNDRKQHAFIAPLYISVEKTINSGINRAFLPHADVSSPVYRTSNKHKYKAPSEGWKAGGGGLGGRGCTRACVTPHSGATTGTFTVTVRITHSLPSNHHLVVTSWLFFAAATAACRLYVCDGCLV